MDKLEMYLFFSFWIVSVVILKIKRQSFIVSIGGGFLISVCFLIIPVILSNMFQWLGVLWDSIKGYFFIALVLIVPIINFFLSGDKNGASIPINSMNKSPSDKWKEKRASGLVTTHEGVKIKGVRLPKHSSVGTIRFYFDNKRPMEVATKNGKKIYQVDGCLQAIFEDADQANKIEFINGDVVDIYIK